MRAEHEPQTLEKFCCTCRRDVDKQEKNLDFGSIPRPVMGTTRDYCRYMKAQLTPDLGSMTVDGTELTLISEKWRSFFDWRAKNPAYAKAT